MVNTNDLTILPVKKPKDAVRKNKRKINPILPQPPFLWSLVANVKSGKSCFIMNLIFRKNFYRGYFDTIYYVSPSVENDDTCWAVRDDEEENIIYGDTLENI